MVTLWAFDEDVPHLTRYAAVLANAGRSYDARYQLHGSTDEIRERVGREYWAARDLMAGMVAGASST